MDTKIPPVPITPNGTNTQGLHGQGQVPFTFGGMGGPSMPQMPMPGPMQMGLNSNHNQMPKPPLTPLSQIEAARMQHQQMIMMQQQYQFQCHQQMMMSMAAAATMNPMMMMGGGFNPYAMMNPAMLQQQQTFMNSRAQTPQGGQGHGPGPFSSWPPQSPSSSWPRPPPPTLPADNEDSSETSEGELQSSEEETDSDSDSESFSNNNKRMGLPHPPAPQLEPEPIVKEDEVDLKAKKQRTNSEIEAQDTFSSNFRNPNANATQASYTCDADKNGKNVSETSNPGGDLKQKSEDMDCYQQKLTDYRRKVQFNKNHVWAKIASAEAAEETAQEFDVVSMVDTFKILRGPETYEVGAWRKTRCIYETGPADLRK